MLQSHASKIKNDKIQRWRIQLSNYKFDIRYRPGTQNIVADVLSRQVCGAIIDDRLKQLHQALCHPGVTRLTHWVRSKNLSFTSDDVKRVVSTCSICAEVKPRFNKNIGTLIKATMPFERLAMDFKGPIPSSTKNKYILTIIDEYSRFPFAYACTDMSTETIIKHLSDIFSTFGMPAMIYTDQGSSFMSAGIKDFLHSKGISTSRSSPYNPKGNGQVERLNGTLWQTIRLGLREKNLPITMWETVIMQALHCIRSLLCTTTNETPHDRMFNHPRRSSFGQSMPSWLQPGKVFLKKFIRDSKYDSLVEEVDLLEANPYYSSVRLSNGREMIVSNRHLAPRGLVPPETNTIEVTERINQQINHEDSSFCPDHMMNQRPSQELIQEDSSFPPDQTMNQFPQSNLNRPSSADRGTTLRRSERDKKALAYLSDYHQY